MIVLPACMHVYHVCAWYLQRPEEGVRSPGTEVIDSCKPPCGCWELSLGVVRGLNCRARSPDL